MAMIKILDMTELATTPDEDNDFLEIVDVSDTSEDATGTNKKINVSNMTGGLVKLSGRSGGQTIVGGTAASDDLTFSTTSDGSKGSYIYSELTTLGIMSTSALGVVTIASDLAGLNALLSDATLDPTKIVTLNTEVATTDTGTDGTITFTTDGLEAMRINSDQLVLIGTTTKGTTVSSADALVIGDNTTFTGLTIMPGDNAVGELNIGSSLGGKRGSIGYSNSDESMRFLTTGSEGGAVVPDSAFILVVPV